MPPVSAISYLLPSAPVALPFGGFYGRVRVTFDWASIQAAEAELDLPALLAEAAADTAAQTSDTAWAAGSAHTPPTAAALTARKAEIAAQKADASAARRAYALTKLPRVVTALAWADPADAATYGPLGDPTVAATWEPWHELALTWLARTACRQVTDGFLI